MDDPDLATNLMDSTSSKIQQLQKAFAELERHHAVTLNLKWKALEEHFHGLERSLKRRFHELEDQEKGFEQKTRKARELLEKREAAVLAKEHASLERLQEKRDAAAVTIAGALQKYRKVSSVEPAVTTCHDQSEPPSTEDEVPGSVAAEDNLEDVGAYSEDGNIVELSFPQLVKFCEEMDSEGMHKFISDNRKKLAVLREEIPLALKSAANPAKLLLKSLDDFYPIEASNVDGKKDSALLGLRRTCIMLLECLSILLLNSDEAYVSDVVTDDIKKLAKAIAKEWKPKLDALDIDDSNGNSLEAHAFLQLLATFGVTSDFDEDELSLLIPMVSRRRQAAELCRFLGLSDKMPGIIEVLVNSGRQIDAVNLAFAFELTERFSPVRLLKSYLSEASKSSSTVKPGNMSPATVQNEINERELTALKAVIKCIEEHKLEEQCPLDSLQKRLLLLEKAKAEKKRATEVAKPQSKRPRANGVGCGPRTNNVPGDKQFYPRVTDRYPQQYVYESRPYGYVAPVDHHMPPAPFMGSTAYGFPPSHGNYFGNGYQYPTQYLH